MMFGTACIGTACIGATGMENNAIDGQQGLGTLGAQPSGEAELTEVNT